MMGMGGLEILVVLFVGFIVLGPSKMVEAARFIGKTIGQARGLVNELHQIGIEENENDGEIKKARKDQEGATINPEEDPPVPFQTEEESRRPVSIPQQPKGNDDSMETSSTNRADE